MSYGVALALTVAIEGPLYTLALSRWANCRPAAGAVRGVAVNLVSHPLAIALTLPLLAALVGFWPALIAIEVGVFMLEGALLYVSMRHVEPDRLGLISLGCNVVSLTIGLALLA